MLLAPSNLLHFSRLSTHSSSLEMEALGRSECVLMKRRRVSAGQTSEKDDILFFCISKMACFCA